jgi:hypothetical protein
MGKISTFNTVLFVFFATYGYYQYFIYDAPPERSLSVGIAFTLIVVLYQVLLRQRKK